jgi:hypothetical protein
MKICGKCKKEKDLSEFYCYKKKVRHWCKECDRINTIIRQTIFKQQCVNYKGGKCENCGYSKYIGALDFHHKDPSQKDFNISKVKLRKFDRSIKKELDKCSILCANCHREEHQKYQLKEINGLWDWYDKRNKEALLEKPPKNIICKCGNKKTHKSIQCLSCKNKDFLSRDINQVIEKIKEVNFSYTKAGKFFGMSDNGLRKFVRSKGYNVKTLEKLIL